MKKISALDNIVIVIPCLNPDEQLNKTINGILNEGFTHIVLVNDGSDEETLSFFDQAKAHDEVIFLEHEINKGKGAALKTAFSYIIENMPEVIGVVTADSDGQHLPSDIHKIAEKLQSNTDEVILGSRNLKAENVPGKSSIGNRLASSWFKFACGVMLADTQTGLRGIPITYLQDVVSELKGDRYEYETHMLIHFAEKKIPIKEQTIETVYINDNSGSHYRPIKDSLRIASVFFKHSTFIKQIVSSVLSFFSDMFLFWLLSVAIVLDDVALEVFICTAVARVCSSILNYTLNRNFVFKNKGSVASSASKYFIVAACMMTLSWLGVSQLATMIKVAASFRVFLKMIVDGMLFLLSYFVQKNWVFAKGRNND